MFLAAVLGDMIFVISCSNQPKRTTLSKNLILLLSYGGVPDSFFMDLLKKALEESQCAFSNKRTALRGSFLNFFVTITCSIYKFFLSPIFV